MQNAHEIESNALEESTIICNTSHLDRKTSNIKDNSDDSDVD